MTSASDAPFAVDFQAPANDGREPPYDLDAERALVSCALIGIFAEGIEGNDFYSEKHRRVYEAAASLVADGLPVDNVTVTTRLRDLGRLQQCDGPGGITELSSVVCAFGNVKAYAATVREKATARRAILVGQRVAAQGFAGCEPSGIIAAAVHDLEELRPPASAETEVLYGTDLAEALPPVEWLCGGLKITTGAPTLAAGNSYGGKSLTTEDLAIAVAMGGDAFGMFGCRRGRALILDYDGQGRRISQERAQRLARGRGIDLRDLGNAIAYKRRPGFYLDDADAVERLLRLLDGYSLCVIDSWRGATPATDEWKRGPVQVVGDRLELVSTKLGCVVVIIDHNVKPPRDGKSDRSQMHDVHGSTAKVEMAQSHFSFTGEEGVCLTRVKHTKERVTGQTISPFALRFEDIERGGDPRWGLRVAYVDREELKGQGRETERFSALKEEILRVVGSEALKSKNAIAARIKAAREAKLQAIRELVEDGTLVQPGGEGTAFHVVA